MFYFTRECYFLRMVFLTQIGLIELIINDLVNRT